MYQRIQPYRFRLSNGTGVVGTHLKKSLGVSVSVWVRCGSRYEGDGQRGYAHFLEHMLFRGTASRSAFEIARQVDRVGGQLNAATGREYTYYYLSLVKEQAPFAFELLSDMVHESKLPKNELDKERKVVLEEISMCFDSPEDFLADVFLENAYRGHPLGRNILGTRKSIADCSRDKLQRFRKKAYQPENLLISVAGNLDEAAVKGLASKHFSLDSANTTKLGEIKVQAAAFTPGRKHYQRDLQQVHFCLGYDSISKNSEFKDSMYVFDTLLGANMSSILFQRIREDLGLCYTIESFYHMFKETGVYGIYGATNKRRLRKAVDEIQKILGKELNSLVTTEKIEEAKDSICGRLALGMESTEAIMAEVAYQEMFYGGYTQLQSRIKRIRAVTRDSIMALIEDLFIKKPLLVTLGDLGDKEKNFYPY